jgi:hypothetical protein
MSLFFIGCSHTYGDDLLDPANASWPALIAQHRKESFLNAAASGGTNDRIMYHTIKNINEFDEFYVAWTQITRFTRYRADNNYEINFNQQLVNQLYGNDPSYYTYGKIHYTYWSNELYSFKLWLQQIILLQHYLNSKSKKYLMLNTFNNHIGRWCSGWQDFNNNVQSLLCFDSMNNDQLYAEHQEIQQLLTQINFSNFYKWGKWDINQLSEHYPTGHTNHLLEEGHQAIANDILTHDKN